MFITKRIDMNMGYACNIRCRFCYYQQSVCEKNKENNLTTEQIKYWLAYFRKKGKNAVDLTGGEPTIRPDIIEIIEYAKKIGYSTICIITNGIRMADKNFCEAILKAGVNDILFSIHGHSSEIHENLTGCPGSFNKIMTAVDNVRNLSSQYKVRLRSNSVINGVSYASSEKTADFLIKSGFKIINFIMFNPIVEAQSSDNDMNVSYEQAAPFLKNVIDKYASQSKITIRYMPFCLMPGYEKYITNTAQIQYDPDEWDYYLRTRMRNGFFMHLGALIYGFIIHPSKKRMFNIGWEKASREAIKYSLALWNKTKGKQCLKCSYNKICDGLWRDYAKHKGFDELKPFEGKTIEDPSFFMHG